MGAFAPRSGAAQVLPLRLPLLRGRSPLAHRLAPCTCTKTAVRPEARYSVRGCRYVRKHIGQKVRLRLTPEVRFIMDDSLERSMRVSLGSGAAGLARRPWVFLPAMAAQLAAACSAACERCSWAARGCFRKTASSASGCQGLQIFLG
jgi:hypothetical protein